MTLLAIAIVFIWAGCILSISFFESWMKFRVKGVDLKIGLSIGKKIFTALNRIEWVLCLLVLVSLCTAGNVKPELLGCLLLVVTVLCLQSFLLLPNLNKRAVRIIAGEDLPTSSVHIYFVVLELVKLILLVVIGYNLLTALT